MTWADARNAGGAAARPRRTRASPLRPIKAGEFLTYENCAPDELLIVTQIRRRLDQADSQFARA